VRKERKAEVNALHKSRNSLSKDGEGRIVPGYITNNANQKSRRSEGRSYANRVLYENQGACYDSSRLNPKPTEII